MAKVVKKSGVSDEEKLWGFLVYFLSIIGFILAILTKKNNKYIMYHASQSLALFIVCVGVMFIGIIPIIGWILAPLASIVLFVLWILGIINGATGKMKQLPLRIGELGEMLKF